MGKNKGGGKKPNVFKVAGAKSLKVKSKPKPLIKNFKKINEIVRKNIERRDKDVVYLENYIRQKKEEKVKAKSDQQKKKNKEEETAKLEEEKQKALEKLSDMQL